ncbi:MAG: ubiquinone biosynthesis protein UbiE [Blastopirellula sp.]|nr:MAG: ubiquinone biosynthesis protein UbiE [Blastopirellula sp.]
MIERILEPELMDTDIESQDYDAMDHKEVNRVFVDDLCAAINLTPRTPEEDEEDDTPYDVIDLGTGTALIPIELCERIPQARIMACDAAVSMLEIANFRIEVACITHRVQLNHSDAKDLPFEEGMFHLVMSNSIVHHIPEPKIVLENAIRVTSEGGHLFFRDLMRPESKEQLDQLVKTYTSEENENQQKMFAESLHAALTLDEIQDLVEELGFARDTVTATSDRHWTWVAQKSS